MPACLLAFVAGVWLLQLQPDLPGVFWCFGVPLLAFAGLLAARSPHEFGRVVLPAIWFACGFLWASLVAHLRLADALAPEWEGRDIDITGVVAALVQRDERGVRFGLDVERVQTPLAHVPAHLSLTWYAQPARVPPELRPGQRWRMTVRLRRPHGTSNPHGFDSEVRLLERGVRATGYVHGAADAMLVDSFVPRFRYWLERAREWSRARILAAVPGTPVGGVLVALAIGDQPAISSEQWTVFTRTGVNHLMSISGLHITLVAGLVFAVVGWGWRRLSWLALRVPARKAAAAAALIAALLYALLSGFGVPAQRTLYMLAVVTVGLALGRAAAGGRVLAAALFAVVVIDPWAVLSAGFWLSFGAVALIVYTSAGRLRRGGWLTNWARIQWAITIGLVPLLLALFQQVSVVSPLANAVAIPLVSLAVVPLTLLGLIVPTDLTLQLAGKLMSWCYALLQTLSAMPAGVWQQAAPPGWAVPVGLAGVLWLLAPRGFPARWLGIVALLPVALVRAPTPTSGRVWVDVLDVGQGFAAIVRTTHHALAYDAGPAFAGDTDSGSRILVPYLRGEGVTQLDGLIISHDDSDHSGGAASLLQALPVGWVASSMSADAPALASVRRALRCFAGQRWEWDGVSFEILHPSWDGYNKPATRDNDRSCVLRVIATGGSVLLTADIESRSESELLARTSELASTVLVVPHHGSATSSTHAFLDHVRPRIAIVPVGYRNRFGHPRAEVLARYTQRGVLIYRTDRDGAVLVRIEDRVAVTAWRAQRSRYWQDH